MLAIDFAGARPSPAAIAYAGYEVVLRYLSGYAWKDLTAAEADTYVAVGLGIGLVWETTGARALDGAAAGAVDGATATAMARAVGAPAGTPLLANIGDFAAAGSQIDQIAAYYTAFGSPVIAAGYIRGGYATGFIIDALAGRGYTGVWWQNAMNDAGQPGSTVSPNAAIYQRTAPTKSITGTPPDAYDEDVIVKPVWYWGQPKPAPAPQPTPTPSLPKGVIPVFLANDGQAQYVVCESPTGPVKHHLPGGSEVELLAEVIPNQPKPMPVVLGSFKTV